VLKVEHRKSLTRDAEQFISTPATTLNSQLLMKSAYELAMERLEQQTPSVKLDDRQKAEIAELENTYKAKTAEQEIFLRGQIAKAAAEGKAEDVQQIEQQLARELRRLNEECESKKEKVRAKKS
jgi:hypothetical protein